MSRRLRILMLENPARADYAQRRLGKALIPFSVRRAVNETEFREALESFRPDVILSDYSQPFLDLRAAFAVAQELCPETPFVFVSESVGDEKLIYLLEHGISDRVLRNNLTPLGSAVRPATQ